MNKRLAWFVGLTMVLMFVSSAAAQTITPLTTLEAPGKFRQVVVCTGGQSLAALDRERSIHIWNLASGEHKSFKTDLAGGIDPGAFACDSKTIAVGSQLGTVILLNVDGTVRKRVELKEEIASIALSPDGSKLAVNTGNSPVQVWDVASATREWTGTTDFGNTYGARISANGNVLYTADGDVHVRAYDAKGKMLYAEEQADLLEPFDVSVSGDGKTLAVAGAAGTIELHDSASGKLLKKTSSAGNPIFLLAMAPKSSTVLALILDALELHVVGIGYWNADKGDLKKLALDPNTVVGFGSDTKNLLLIRQDSPKTLSVDRVE